MEIIKFKSCIPNVKKDILATDDNRFFTLSRLLEEKCDLTVTDNKHLVICYSAFPSPVWIWLSKTATENELERAYLEIKSSFGFDRGFRFNATPPVAEYILKRANDEGIPLALLKPMLAYNCHSPVAPAQAVMGKIKVAEVEDIEDAFQFLQFFHKNTNFDSSDINANRKKAEDLIANKEFFFWVDENGEKVACCSAQSSEKYGILSSVYTRNDKRRMGYASALIFEVSNLILKSGKLPAIYTDADNPPSNACYTALGFEVQGALTTIG